MVEAGLRPDELDLLEDALEDLELEDGLDRWTEAELGPRVRERLVDYRSILAASREALPFEDVPRGVLDGVLEQARQAAVVAPTTVSGGSESWWSRLRRGFMVPALALAGTAVLVLWVFDPDDQAKLEPPPSAVEAKTVAQLEAPGAEIELIFRKRLRSEIKFPTVQDLIAQIHRDVEATRAFFNGI